MSQGRKGKLNYRCPSCFMRDLDIDMFYDKEKDEFYCMRVSTPAMSRMYWRRTKW